MNDKINKPKQAIQYHLLFDEYVNRDNETTREFYNTICSDRGYKPREFNSIPEIKKVIFNEPATIVFWSDGTKTVVKAHGEDFDVEKGLTMAISKKAFGNKGNYFNNIKKWTENFLTVNLSKIPDNPEIGGD